MYFNFRIKNHSDGIITCGDINDQTQKLEINVLNEFIHQPIIQFMQF